MTVGSCSYSWSEGRIEGSCHQHWWQFVRETAQRNLEGTCGYTDSPCFLLSAHLPWAPPIFASAVLYLVIYNQPKAGRQGGAPEAVRGEQPLWTKNKMGKVQVYPRGNESITSTVGWLLEEISPEVPLLKCNRSLFLPQIIVQNGFSWLVGASAPLRNSGTQDGSSWWLPLLLGHRPCWHPIFRREKGHKDTSVSGFLGAMPEIGKNHSHSHLFKDNLVTHSHRTTRDSVQWRGVLCPWKGKQNSVNT